MNNGKNTKYQPEFVKQVMLLSGLGANETEIGDYFHVDQSTVNRWKREHPEFGDAYINGRVRFSMLVLEELIKNAQDRYVEEEEVHVVNGKLERITVRKFYRGDKWAQWKILSAYHPNIWSDTQRVQHTLTNINISKIDLSKLSDEDLGLANKLIPKSLGENIESSNEDG